MTTPLTAAQQAQQDNRDQAGKYRHNQRSEADHGIQVPASGPEVVAIFDRPTGSKSATITEARSFCHQFQPGPRVLLQEAYNSGSKLYEVETSSRSDPGGFGHPDSSYWKLRPVREDGTLAEYREHVSPDRLASGFGPIRLRILGEQDLAET